MGGMWQCIRASTICTLLANRRVLPKVTVTGTFQVHIAILSAALCREVGEQLEKRHKPE